MKKMLFGLLLVVLLAGAVGCSGGSDVYVPSPIIVAPKTMSSSGVNIVVPAPAPTYTLSPPAQESLGGNPLGWLFDRGSSSSASAAPDPVIIAPSATTAPSVWQGGETDYYRDVNDLRMVIRSGSMQLVVKDIAEAVKKISELAGNFGGYVVESTIQESQSRQYGNISIRVLSARFDEALTALKAMAEDVKSENTSGEDVTEEYTDLDSKLRNLQAAEAQLLTLMARAGNVTEILEVQKELVSTRSEIEQIKGRMQYLEQSASLSLLRISLEQSKLTIEFNATARNIKQGTKIYFVPTLTGGFQPYSYEWDFGDGQTSTGGAPQHTYKKSGTYTVSLKVTDDHGYTTSFKRDNYITVLSGWEAGNTARSAWNGFVGFMRFLVDLLTWIGIFSPVWIVILVILYFAWWRRRKKAK
jgi:hypothetical protein